jgi:hypothetical protein
MRGRLKGWLGLGGETARGVETTCMRRARSRRGNRVQLACDVAVACSSVAGRQQGAAGELTGATGRAPGKAVEGGAHSSGGAALRQWRMLRAVAFVDGEGASMADSDGGTTLQCRCGRGMVRAASNGDNSGRWEGLTMKRRRWWCSDRNQRGGGGLRWRKPERLARRWWRRRGARA